MTTPAEGFHLNRHARSQRARTLNALLIPLDDDYSIPLRRAPDIREACGASFGALVSSARSSGTAAHGNSAGGAAAFADPAILAAHGC